MKNFFLADYLGCILFKTLGPVLRILPVEISLFLGRRLGDCFYYFDLRHRARAYANIRSALGSGLTSDKLFRLTRSFYQSFGQSIIDVFIIPLVDRDYIDKHIEISGVEHINEALKRGKGAILAGVHAGSWEFYNIISANLGFPFVLFVKDQKFPRLNRLLNNYRKAKGCRIITRDEGLRGLISALKNNQAIGMMADQGGKSGILVDFFKRPASMPTGAVKLALKYGAALIPIFFVRKNGPAIKVWAGNEINMVKTGDEEGDIKQNLQRVVAVFEDFIRNNPKEYLWTYKIWKHSNERDIVILDDGKTGHLRQSEAVLKIAKNLFNAKDVNVRVNIVKVGFKNRVAKILFNIFTLFSGRYSCQGRLKRLKIFLKEETYKDILNLRADLVISAGSSTAGVNFILASENQSQSIVIMRPGLYGADKFDLVIIPRHDRPLKRKNILTIEGALNLVDIKYLEDESRELVKSQGLNKESLYISLLLGGDSKSFRLSPGLIRDLIREVKALSKGLGAEILVTTSRRTSSQVEEVIKSEFKDYPGVRLMVIANEQNIPQAVGGILGLSKIVIASPESISMISEAVNSKRYVFVFKAPGLSFKHKLFLKYFAGKQYIYLVAHKDLNSAVNQIWRNRPVVPCLRDNYLVGEALKKII
ncbi:MAG TPA: ELM1/GtrOC1 family putative glycosyltransferase [Candidatus Omnitrophota bacterium]|nr:ELM1/GtrOC1 family putative glycosyltransferase [Candidatus Omnitrophota bacterium]